MLHRATPQGGYPPRTAPAKLTHKRPTRAGPPTHPTTAGRPALANPRHPQCPHPRSTRNPPARLAGGSSPPHPLRLDTPPAAKSFPPNPPGGVCGFGGEGFRAANPQTPPARPKPDRRHQPHGKRIYGGSSGLPCPAPRGGFLPLLLEGVGGRPYHSAAGGGV
jgi:hypothetical protein